QIFDLHAEAVDQGNYGRGADFTIVAGVSRVTLYVLDDTSLPLVVDTETDTQPGDGICDAINPNVIPINNMPPTPQKAVQIDMVALPVLGVPDFVPPYPIYEPGTCVLGTDTQHPDSLCLSTPLTMTLADYISNPPRSLIWIIPPYVQDNLLC